MAGESFILMGVSGSGKTLIGSKVAALLSAKFIDGDDLHPAKNIDKMSQGIPLSDEDRLPWLERLNDASYSLYKKNETGKQRGLCVGGSDTLWSFCIINAQRITV